MEDKNKNILSHLGKIPVFLARHFIFYFFVVVFSVIFLANLLFYKYYILSQEITPKAEQGRIVINEKSYNDLLKIWEEQDKKFQDSELKNHLDLLNVR